MSSATILNNIKKRINNMGYDLIETKKLEDNYISISSKNNNSYKYFVLILSEDYMKKKESFKSLLSIFSDSKELDIEVISASSFKNTIKQEIKLRSDTLKIKRFDINKFIIDPSNHFLVPTNIEIIKEEKEKKNILEELKIDSYDNLPYIYINDPQVIIYGGEINDIYKSLETHNNGYSLEYRLVVRSNDS